ncbi:MAG: DUF6640 family protein [Pseudomonadota bacterium]
MVSSISKILLKVFVSALTVFYGLVPAVADLNETHIFNPLWSQHARFHGAWFLAFAAGVAGTALFLIWLRDDVFVPIVLGLMFTSGFWVATLFRSAYGGELVDTNGHTHSIAGTESNIFLFTILSILFLAALAAELWLSRNIPRHAR